MWLEVAPMNKRIDSQPSLWQDLGVLAGLYRNVITMMTHRVRYGADWQDTVFSEEMYQPELAREERELVHTSRGR
jgi:hypothetical protein